MVTAAEYITDDIEEQASAVELLSAGLATDKVESYVRALRSMGTAVHSNYVSTPDAFEEHLREHDTHVVLVNVDSDSLDAAKMLDVWRNSVADAALVVVGGSPDIMTAHRVRDWLADESDPRAPTVILREHGDLIKRRQLLDAKHRLHETEHRCDALMESSKEAIAYVHEGMHVRANPVYLELFGIPDAASMEGMPLMDLVSRDSRKELKRFLHATNAGVDGPQLLETRCRAPDGPDFAAQLEFTRATIDGEPCVQIIVRQQDTGSEEVERLKNLAARDTHTGLYHRGHFISRVEEAIPRLYSDERSEYALFYVAIDDFADIRDSCGLNCAEGLLKEAAATLEGVVPGDALLARFGDFSFTLLAQVESKKVAEDMGTELCRAVAGHAFASTDQFVSPTVSVGIARSKQGRVTDAQEFINRAYKAFQNATAGGGNDIAEYDPREHDEGKDVEADEDDIVDLVQFAIDNERFLLRFQPMLEPMHQNNDNYFVGLHLRDADDVEHQASFFLSSAQRAGLLKDIDRWVLGQCLAMIEQRSSGKRELCFHVPLSMSGIADEEFASWLRRELESRQIDASRFVLLLDNNDIRNRIQAARLTVSLLNKLGCRVMLNNFGTSPEDIAVLKHLPGIAGVRFDPSLTSALEQDAQQLSHLQQSIAQLHQAELKVVVTSVDHASALAQVWSLGTDYIQGEFLSSQLEKPDFDFARY